MWDTQAQDVLRRGFGHGDNVFLSMARSGDHRLAEVLGDVHRLARRLEFYAGSVGSDNFGDTHLGEALTVLMRSKEVLETLVATLEDDPAYQAASGRASREAAEREPGDYGI